MINLEDPKQAQAGMMQADSVYWAETNGIKLIGGIVFDTEKYRYQVDIMRSEARKKAVMKGAQAGITTIFMLDAIHGLIYNQYPQGVIYYFPSEKAVEGFSKTRFGPMVADNPAIRKHLRNTNSVSIKKVGKTFLNLLGARATQTIQGKKDSTSVRSTPADYVIRDERDLFDEDMAEQTKQRLLNSEIKKEVDLGTPTIPDWGVSKVFNESDQRYWMIPCTACNQYTCLTLEFPESIKFKDDKPYFGCIKCGKLINPVSGEWVAKHQDREIAGWLISHFLNPNCDLVDVMRRWEKCQREGKIGEFYNSILGMPYIAAEDKLTMSDVLHCCGTETMRAGYQGTAMGADIGAGRNNIHHAVIAEKIDKDRAKIIYMARVTGFDMLHDIAKKYNVKSAVIDFEPQTEAFRKFQKAEPYKVYGCSYRDR